MKNIPVTGTKKTTLSMAFAYYIAEHARPKGCNIPRIARTAKNLCAFHGRHRDPTLLKQADHRAYLKHRVRQGVQGPTVRRELAMLSAALNHSFKEDRFPSVFKIVLPPGSSPRRRFLSQEEMERVRAMPMAPRIYMFFEVAFTCAARSRAIEELTWDRVDFANGVIDFNVPDRIITNKRRAVIPMPRELRPVLEAAYAARKSDYVIGVGRNGKCSCTYRECKAVMRAAGIDEKGVARHVARKTWASHALQSGRAIGKVAAYLGDTPTTTERSYAFILPTHLDDVANFRENVPA